MAEVTIKTAYAFYLIVSKKQLEEILKTKADKKFLVAIEIKD